MKKTLKLSDVYIAYLPLVVFLLNLLYGLLNIEGVGDSDSRYSLLFGVFGLVPTVLGYGISFLANLIVGITYVIKAKNRTKCLIAFLLIGNIFLAIFLMFVLRFKMIVSFDFIKDIDLWSFIFSLFLFPYLDWIYQKVEYNQKVSRFVVIIVLAGTLSPFLGSEIQTYLRNNAKVQQLQEFYHSRGLNYELTLKSSYYDSNISDVGVFDVFDKGVTLKVGAKYTRQKLKYVTFIDQDYGLKEFIENAVSSDEAQIVLKDFKSVVEDAIKKKGYDLSVFDAEDQPLASPGFQISRSFRITSFIKEKAAQNQNSSSPEKQAFGGYAAISLKDYMKGGDLRLCLTLSERDKLKLDDIDFSGLSDGHYMINNDYFIVNNGMYTIVEDEGDFENFLLRESSKQFYSEDFYKIEKLD
ncbi:glutamyl-tRNA amidotransferase [Streptococcus mitis]|mgnify:FL=1|jgi:aspartyl/glutamyl-tRNA(asn/gln) amidotransferase subunit C|uniref:glutamyl-tRNA amidotransferase n=1 Tax=Streptococcus mitis TaxID=28037 RepID=UPI002001B51C|nr:glutamyl-tRNA amidotransferase [Streptococcus mitis]